jgi:two-component system, NtrC family, sensor kinase
MNWMKSLLKIFWLLLSPFFMAAQSQRQQIDSMHMALKHAANDTIRMKLYKSLGFFYDDVNLDSSVHYNEKGVAIAQQLQLKLNEAEILMGMSFPLTKMGNYPRSLKVLMQASAIAEDPSNEKSAVYLLTGQAAQTYRLTILGYIHLGLGYLYANTGNYEKGLAVYPEGLRIAKSIKDTVLLANMYGDMGVAYNNLNELDSALLSRHKALKYFSILPFDERKFEGDVYAGIGGIYQQLGKLDLAKENYEKAIQVSGQHNNPALLGEAYLKLAKLYQLFKKPDSSLYSAKKALEAFTIVGKENYKADAYRMISDFYGDQKNADSSFAYLRLSTVLHDSLDRAEKKKLQEFQLVGFDEQLRLQELEKEKTQIQSKIRTYAMLSGIGVFMLIAFMLYRNNRSRRKINEVLQKQKEELQSTLSELKSTQAQLIQSEKMASLGELTAGIAHEIQNPLNFVNNFSEVNKEMLEELKAERLKQKAERDEELEDELIKDVIANEEKINHHGKRADAIVKGMLEHSRTSTGIKEPTDINKLADEYLRLSYHGLRAKDKSFNADFKIDFDETIGKINIIPQDIGRVLLNLINNAFYATNEKLTAHRSPLTDDYKPLVSVSTRKITPLQSLPRQVGGTGAKVEITVSDNGNGIPVSIKEKIFQPFFTTKPTGQGTGLGLSLSYDIIKAHGGEIKVETKEGEGSTFTIQIPIN